MNEKKQTETSNLLLLIDNATRSDKELTPQKFKSIFNGLSSNTKKVYEAVPISAVWDANQIIRELQRKGVIYTKQTVEANLNILVKNGLVDEHEKGHFSRHEIRKDGDRVSIKKVVEEAKTEQPVIQESSRPIDKLSRISDIASDLIRVATALKEEISLAAIEIEETLEEAEGKNQKLKQLQELLKGLSA